MVSQDLEQIVKGISDKIVDEKLHIFGRAARKISQNSFEYNGYTFEIFLEEGTLKVAVEHSGEITDLPNYSRLSELVNLGRSVLKKSGTSSSKINRGVNYLSKGKIESLQLRNCGTIPPRFVISHKVSKRNNYNPVEFFQSAYDVAFRPLLLLAQNYPLHKK